MSIVICCVGLLIAGALTSIANAIKELAHKVHVHAEVMTEIKHQGIGCDKQV